jgi:hypothetical protein
VMVNLILKMLCINILHYHSEEFGLENIEFWAAGSKKPFCLAIQQKNLREDSFDNTRDFYVLKISSPIFFEFIKR